MGASVRSAQGATTVSAPSAPRGAPFSLAPLIPIHQTTPDRPLGAEAISAAHSARGTGFGSRCLALPTTQKRGRRRSFARGHLHKLLISAVFDRLFVRDQKTKAGLLRWMALGVWRRVRQWATPSTVLTLPPPRASAIFQLMLLLHHEPFFRLSASLPSHRLHRISRPVRQVSPIPHPKIFLPAKSLPLWRHRPRSPLRNLEKG
jgi:hypothetical protein